MDLSASSDFTYLSASNSIKTCIGQWQPIVVGKLD